MGLEPLAISYYPLDTKHFGSTQRSSLPKKWGESVAQAYASLAIYTRDAGGTASAAYLDRAHGGSLRRQGG